MFDIDKFFADSFPVVLSADAELDEGDNKQLDVQSLSNFFDTPMVIDEIRTQIVTPNVEIELGNFGGSVRFKLSLDRYALSSVYIPVGCLGPTFDGATIDSTTYQATSNSPESLNGAFADAYFMGFFRWKLPRPLVVPAGMALEAKISREIDGLTVAYPSAGPLSVNVAYAGRVARRQMPSGVTIPIPWVGLFENQFTTPSVAISDQLDLYNPFQQPLTVQRLIGRWWNAYLATGLPDATRIALDTTGTLGRDSIDFPPTQVKLFNGFYVTNGFIPGCSVFESNTRSLGVNVDLDRGEGFEISIDATSGLPSTGPDNPPLGYNRSLVTMIGWRNQTL